MKFTLSWLKEHLDTIATADGIAERLTMIGLEVESVEDPSVAFAPFRIARVVSAEPRRHSASVTGYHVGVDAAFFLSRHIGLGGLVRFSRASVDFASEDGGLVPMDLGGVHLSGGLRVRF